MIGTTITQFLIEEQQNYPKASGDLTSVINDVVTACKTISAAMRYGGLSDDDLLGVAATENVQGETQKTLDIIANDLFLRRTEFGGHVAAMVSEEMETVFQAQSQNSAGHYLLLYDPVDGSSNIAENATIGTIFSILRRPDDATGKPTPKEFLQPGDQQVCAGYAIYGPSTMIVMTTGNGVNGFTLDPLIGEFIISHPNMEIPKNSPRICVNLLALNQTWDPRVEQHISECMKGRDGPRGRDFELRWSAGAVADVHRLLISGGIYFNTTNAMMHKQGILGKLRLLYEVNPLSFLVEQAGGMATTGQIRALEVEPESLHQRCPVILGSNEEVRHLLAY